MRLLDYPLADVFDLLRQHLDHNRRTQLRQHEQAQPTNNEKVIRRPAGDDWF